MEFFKCNECGKIYDNIKSLSMHRSRQHNINAKITFDEIILNNNKSLCKCGCGEETQFLSVDKGYREYIRGHSQRINNNWGHNPNAIRKSHETQKKMHESGGLTMWNKGLTIEDPRVKSNIEKVMANPNRSHNISKKLSGVSKTKEHKEKLSISQSNIWSEEKRNKQRLNRIAYIKNNGNKSSLLEKKFMNILDKLDIKYVYQYAVCGFLFDFYLKDFDILIEIDGDFWHCNPNSKHKIPIYESQLLTIENDKKKNKICETTNIKLIRIWESDIKNNLEDVINMLRYIK